MDRIYTILACEKLEMNKEIGMPTLGHKHFAGWFTNLCAAMNAVKNNQGDIREAFYDYAVIESSEEGIYGLTGELYYFKWNYEKNKYEQIETPDFKNYCGFYM